MIRDQVRTALYSVKELPLLAIAALGAVKLGYVLDLAAANVLPTPHSAAIELYGNMVKSKTTAEIAGAFVFYGLALPIFQEQIFRKSSLRSIGKSAEPAYTLAFSAAFFALFQSGQSFIAGLLGIAFGLAYLHTGSLVPSIVANGALRVIQMIPAIEATRGPRYDAPLDPPITGQMIGYAALGALALATYVWMRRATLAPARIHPVELKLP